MAAPKGNKFALGLTTNGAPPVFDNPEDMQNKIIEYWSSLFNEEGFQQVKPTISGLALFLGFASRQSLYDYADKKDFSYIVKRAQLTIAMHYEEMLDSKSSTGAIFALKNMGWKDKQEIANTNIDVTPLTQEERDAVSGELEDEY